MRLRDKGAFGPLSVGILSPSRQAVVVRWPGLTYGGEGPRNWLAVDMPH